MMKTEMTTPHKDTAKIHIFVLTAKYFSSFYILPYQITYKLCMMLMIKGNTDCSGKSNIYHLMRASWFG